MKHTLLKLAGLAAALSVAAPAGLPAHADHGSPTGQRTSKTIADILLADTKYDDADGFDHRSWDFDIATQAILLFPDLVQAASDPNSQLTVFLPTDAAFRSLVKSLTGNTVRSEQDVFNAVAGLGLDTVKAVLTYHIIPGAEIDYRTALTSDGAELTTLNGATITVEIQGRWFKRVQLGDKDPDLRDPYVVFPDIHAANGIIHAIDRVLLPIDV